MPFVRQFKPKDHFDHYHLYVFDSEVPGHLIVTNLNSTWANVIEFSRVLADIGQLRECIAARDPQIALEYIARPSNWLEAQFTGIPYGATVSILKPVEAYRQILFDMNEAIRKNEAIPKNEAIRNQDTVSPGDTSAFNDRNEAIHNQGTVSPGDMSAFKDRIDAFIKEFKIELAALQSELVRPPEHFSQHEPSSHQRSSFRQRPSSRHRPSFYHCPPSETHMFKDSHHMIITGGTFIQNEGTNLDQHSKFFTKILHMQYITLIVLFV